MPLPGGERGQDPGPGRGQGRGVLFQLAQALGLRPEQRKAFLDELQQTLQDLFTRYGGAEGDAFRLAVACYPRGDPDDRP